MSTLTKAEMRALEHVAAGKVEQWFDINGNGFSGPEGTASHIWRKLSEMRLIEDASGQHGGMGSFAKYKQQLTEAGKAALRNP